MVDGLLAHQGGWDEMLIFLFPVVFGVGLWWIVKRPGPEDDEDDADPRAEGVERS